MTRSAGLGGAWLLGSVLLVVVPSVRAQAVSVPSPATAESPAGGREKDAAVVMSPFEVNTQRDFGFAAAAAVAGGRLAIDLKDSPASYSVLNKEFLDAVQLTTLEQATDWAPNSIRVPDQGNEATFGGAVLVAVRGVYGLFSQRDFFPVEWNQDSYNLDRFDYGRGPNAVLFGFANFQGTQNTVSKVARTDKNFGEVRLAYGSWDNKRTTVDVNTKLGNRAALRINLLAQDRLGWQELEHEQKLGIHLAGKFQLTDNTEIRAEVERGQFRQNIPEPSGYYDAILGWNGSYVYNGLQGTPANAAALGVVSYGTLTSNLNAFVLSPSQSSSSVLDMMGTGRTTAAQNGGTIGGLAVAGTANSFAGATVDELLNAPLNRYALASANSKFSVSPKTKGFGLNSDDFAGRQYNIASLFLTHRLGNFFFEGAGNYSINKRWAVMTAQNGQTAYIDINRNLPNGQPNAMFLQPYTEGQYRRLWDTWEKHNIRLSAAYVLDNTRFGSYAFQGMGGTYDSIRPYNYQLFGVQRFTDKANWSQLSELVLYRQYYNVSHEIGPLPTSANYVDATGAARTVPVGWTDDLKTRGVAFEDHRRLVFGQASVRGRWFGDKLIGILSARQDSLTRKVYTAPSSRDLVGKNWDGISQVYLPFTDMSTWTNLKYVPKDASGNPTGPSQIAANRPRDASGVGLPQYANDKFRDDYSGFPIKANVRSLFAGLVYHYRPWATVAVNYSEGANFNDAPSRFDGSQFGQQKSKGVDFSLRSSFLENRINTTVTYYKGQEANEGFNNATTVPWGSFNTVINAQKVGDLTPNGTNSRSFPLVTSGQWDSRTTENSGVEFETVANLTRSWRTIFNVAFPKSVTKDNAPDFRNYYKANESALRTILGDAGVLINTQGNASLDPAVPSALRAPNSNQQNAANAWNTIYTAYQNIVTGSQDLARAPTFTGNLFTDYTIASGQWKDLKIGGGLNYRGKQVIGYMGSNSIVDPANPAQAIDDPRVGPTDDVYSKAYYWATFNLGYTWRYRKNLAFQFDFKVDNLFDWNKPNYINVRMLPPDGNLSTPARVATPAIYWRMLPRNYSLTVTTSF
jgi:outer membrane receptor for ferric coprogen and ferric-rhodotorulic acid